MDSRIVSRHRLPVWKAAKAQIREVVLKLVSDAEKDYDSWTKAGSIKRSQVVQKIFSDYPILSKVSDQEDIVKYIDEAIGASLKELRKIVSEQLKEDSEQGKGDEQDS